MGQQFEPFTANDSGHLVYVWVDDDEQTWACCAYDHGPLCRLCQRLPDDDHGGTTLALLGQVATGDMEVRAAADGSFSFKLTEQGNEKAKRLIETPGEMQDFYDRLVTTDMEKHLEDDET